MKNMKLKVNFTPYPGMIALALPEGILPDSNIILSREQYLKHIDDKANDYATGELVIAATGEGVTFSKIGDVISLQSHSRLQKLILDNGNRERPTMFWIVRESEILCKHAKDFN